MCRGVICPPIQSMVVVTSPIGDQAPPALAAMITIPAKNFRWSEFEIIFQSKETITIEVVRLSRTAERKKANKPIVQSKVTDFLLEIWSVIILKPW